MVEILKEGLLSSNDGGALESGQFVPGGEGQDPRCPPKGRDGPPSRGQENLVGMIQVLCYIHELDSAIYSSTGLHSWD